MTYTPNVPQSGQTLGNTRQPILDNFTLIGSGFSENHNALGSSGAGKHKFLQMPEQGSAPTTAVNEGGLYTKQATFPLNTTQLFWRNENNGTEEQLTPGSPFRAAVNFLGQGVNGACVLQYNYNVASVTRTAQGLYTIVFTNPLPSDKYVPSGIAMRASNTIGLTVSIQNDNTYTNKVKTTELLISINSGETGLVIDPLAAMIQIIGG